MLLFLTKHWIKEQADNFSSRDGYFTQDTLPTAEILSALLILLHIWERKGKFCLGLLIAVVASESSNAGRPNTDFGSPKSRVLFGNGKSGVVLFVKVLNYTRNILPNMCCILGSIVSTWARKWFAAAGSSVGQDAALSLELAGKMLLLLIQPLWKLGKQIFVHLVCHLSLGICTAGAVPGGRSCVCRAGTEASVCCVAWAQADSPSPCFYIMWVGCALLQILKRDGEDCSCSQPAVFIWNHYLVLNQSSYLWNLLFPFTSFFPAFFFFFVSVFVWMCWDGLIKAETCCWLIEHFVNTVMREVWF